MKCFVEFVIAIGFVGLAGAELELADEYGRPKHPYCFRFTWIGPKFNAESDIGNLTCSDWLQDDEESPCRLPLVATDNSNLPNTTSIWLDNLKEPSRIACKLARGDVCVKYSFMYNKIVESITYMCAKMTIEGEGPAPLRCYTQKLANGRSVEACACESSGGQVPCNRSLRALPSAAAILTLLFMVLIIKL